MDCVKRKNQNQKFRQPHVLFTVHDSTIHPPQRTEKYSSRRHAAIGLMPIEPFFTFKGPSSPPADDADREPKDEYADRERSDDPRSSTSRPPPRSRDAPIDAAPMASRKKEVSREGRPSIHPSIGGAFVARVRAHASVDASRRAFVDRVRSRFGCD